MFKKIRSFFFGEAKKVETLVLHVEGAIVTDTEEFAKRVSSYVVAELRAAAAAGKAEIARAKAARAKKPAAVAKKNGKTAKK